MQASIRFLSTAVLSALLSGCALFSPPADLDVRLAKPSDKALYQVSLRPPQPAAPLNQIHAWELEVKTSSGQAVPNATIGISGGMPQHFHGFPTKPQMTDALGDGRYVIDGVKFSMTGWWQMNIQIDSPHGSDLVQFNTVVTSSGAPAVVAAR
jgi:hypothetical protein